MCRFCGLCVWWEQIYPGPFLALGMTWDLTKTIAATDDRFVIKYIMTMDVEHGELKRAENSKDRMLIQCVPI